MYFSRIHFSGNGGYITVSSSHKMHYNRPESFVTVKCLLY